MLLSGVWKERSGVWRQDHTTHSELCQEACQYLWCRLGECLQCFHHVLKRGLRVISSKGPGHSPGPCLPEDEGTVHNRLVWNVPYDLTNNWLHVNTMLYSTTLKCWSDVDILNHREAVFTDEPQVVEKRLLQCCYPNRSAEYDCWVM